MNGHGTREAEDTPEVGIQMDVRVAPLKDHFPTNDQVRWAKEQWHVSYVFAPWKNSPAYGDGKFVGFKTVIYCFPLNGKTAVKMETYVDPNNNNQWQKVYEFVDQGGWGSAGGECNGAPDQIITWGGPIAAFRWDDGNSIDIKNLSVREIIPPVQ